MFAFGKDSGGTWAGATEALKKNTATVLVGRGRRKTGQRRIG
jgi:hypothetical protein